jgi:alcohol dehydrogenase
MERIVDGGIDSSKFVTHDFKLCDICKAYDVFGHAAHNCALKTFIEA